MAYHFTEGLAFKRKEETEEEFNVTQPDRSLVTSVLGQFGPQKRPK